MASMDEFIDLLLSEHAAMASMDEYIEQLFTEHILDEPIPGAVKKRLIKPLAPRKYWPVPMPPYGNVSLICSNTAQYIGQNSIFS